jgi:hypothetical protein
MTERESQYLDYKSLRLVTGPNADFGALAQTCVCFANGAGGTILRTEIVRAVRLRYGCGE